jgi:hypothetical protein
MSLLEKSLTLEQVLNIFFELYLNEEERKLIEDYLHEDPTLFNKANPLVYEERIKTVKTFVDKLLTEVATTNYTLAPAYLDEGVLEPVVINIKPHGAHHLKVRYLPTIDSNVVEEKIFNLPQEYIGSSFSEPYILSIKED